MKIQRLTYFTIHSPHEPLHIPSDKGLFGRGICTGADLKYEEGFEMEKITHAEKLIKNDTTVKRPIKSDSLADDAEVQVVKKYNIFKRVLFWICGMETYMNSKRKRDQMSKVKIDTSIDEDPLLSKLCDIGAILTMAFCGFVFGFFNKFD